MSVLKVYEFPDPVLKQVSKPVSDFGQALEKTIIDLLDTMNSHKFCVGLAAPQVGIHKRIVLIDISRARKPFPNNGLLILVNPEITVASKYKFVREGCLSIPDYTANVKRAMKISLTYQNINGEIKSLDTNDFEAHAIQHEIDHLDGILFLDKISNPASDLFRRIIH